MKSDIIVHVSEVDLSLNGGMARVEYHWKQEFERRGYKFIHIGVSEIGSSFHSGLFPYNAFKYFKKLNITPKALIVHEPVSGVFIEKGIPCFLESHGLERRAWELIYNKVSLKSKILFPLWRLRNCDKGLSRSNKLLLINSDDVNYAINKYHRNIKDIYLFKNGVDTNISYSSQNENSNFEVLFNGSWIERKGIKVLVDAAKIIYAKGFRDINYKLIGTITSVESVKGDWPTYLHDNIVVISKFNASEENMYLSSADLFVLPSFYEGQPLSLLQAMFCGKCCITTNSCGQKDIINNKLNGILIPVGNAEILAKWIIECYQNPALRERLGNNAKEAMKLRSWKTVSEELVDYVLDNI